MKGDEVHVDQMLAQRANVHVAPVGFRIRFKDFDDLLNSRERSLTRLGWDGASGHFRVRFFSKLRGITVFVLFPSWQVLFETLTFKISLALPP